MGTRARVLHRYASGWRQPDKTTSLRLLVRKEGWLCLPLMASVRGVGLAGGVEESGQGGPPAPAPSQPLPWKPEPQKSGRPGLGPPGYGREAGEYTGNHTHTQAGAVRLGSNGERDTDGGGEQRPRREMGGWWRMCRGDSPGPEACILSVSKSDASGTREETV